MNADGPLSWTKFPVDIGPIRRKRSLVSYLFTLLKLRDDPEKATILEGGQVIRLTHAAIAAEYGCCRKHAMRLAKALEEARFIAREHPDGEGDILYIRFLFKLKGKRAAKADALDVPAETRAHPGRALRTQARPPLGAPSAPTLGSKGAPTLPLSLNETSGETEEREENLKARDRDADRSVVPMAEPDVADGPADATLQPTEDEVERNLAVLRSRRGGRLVAASLLHEWGRLPAEFAAEFADQLAALHSPAPPAPPPAAKPPRADPLDYVRRACGWSTGRDLGLLVARKLKRLRSIARYRQVLRLAEGDGALSDDIAEAFRQALNQNQVPAGVCFELSLAGLVPAQKKPGPGDLRFQARPGARPEQPSRPQRPHP